MKQDGAHVYSSSSFICQKASAGQSKHKKTTFLSAFVNCKLRWKENGKKKKKFKDNKDFLRAAFRTGCSVSPPPKEKVSCQLWFSAGFLSLLHLKIICFFSVHIRWQVHQFSALGQHICLSITKWCWHDHVLEKDIQRRSSGGWVPQRCRNVLCF